MSVLAIAAPLLFSSDVMTERSVAGPLIASNSCKTRNDGVVEPVWAAPLTQIERLKQQLVLSGVKFALLRQDWNHILRRGEALVPLAQEGALADVRRSPETLGITVTTAP
jgi:hypothetical protein